LRAPSVISVEDPDAALIERWRRGDPAAFAALVGRYKGPIYNAAFRVLGNAEDASDITQVVFLRITERLDEYDPHYRFFSWIYRIAINESLNLLRHNGREDPLDEDADYAAGPAASPEWQAGEAELSALIQGALMKLRVQDRMLLVLRHFSECSYREIGEALDLDEKTVKSRLFEARTRLRVLLADLRPPRGAATA
jgi:RNA polymerase sigma-70 factor, ECF subfamily